MTPDERADLEALAEQVCPATVRYNNGDVIPCDECIGGTLHWNKTYNVIWPLELKRAS